MHVKATRVARVADGLDSRPVPKSDSSLLLGRRPMVVTHLLRSRCLTFSRLARWHAVSERPVQDVICNILHLLVYGLIFHGISSFDHLILVG